MTEFFRTLVDGVPAHSCGAQCSSVLGVAIVRRSRDGEEHFRPAISMSTSSWTVIAAGARAVQTSVCAVTY